MDTAPIITIFVRHAEDCTQTDEQYKRCDCRKHLRWTQNGKQYRRKAGTRDWGEAEKVKRQLQDQLAGRTPETGPEDSVRQLQEAIDVFLQDKRVQGVTPSVLGKYTRELDRLRKFCEQAGVYTVQGISRELLTGFCGT
jgi:integrase/recombinase XerD